MYLCVNIRKHIIIVYVGKFYNTILIQDDGMVMVLRSDEYYVEIFIGFLNKRYVLMTYNLFYNQIDQLHKNIRINRLKNISRVVSKFMLKFNPAMYLKLRHCCICLSVESSTHISCTSIHSLPICRRLSKMHSTILNRARELSV